MKFVRVHNAHASTKLSGSVVTIGNFDGCHLGHQVLLAETKAMAQQLSVPSVVLSFNPLPHEYFKRDKHKLMSITEKLLFLDAHGLNYFYAVKFNKALSELSSEQFVQQILVVILHARYVIVGADFCFGKNRSGNIAVLQDLAQRFGFELLVVPDQCDVVGRVSSSRIRTALKDNDFVTAVRLLAHPYSITARVVHGAKLGRTLGYPTVNIPLDRRVPPLHGIYTVRVLYNAKVYYGAASVGTRPAVGGKQLLLEVYIFDFSATIYGARITVEFLQKIRDEMDFASLDELKQQIAKDVNQAKQYLLDNGMGET